MQTNGKKLTEDVLNKALSDLGIKPNNISKSNYSEDEEEDEEEIEKSDIEDDENKDLTSSISDIEDDENEEMKKSVESAKSDSKKDDKMYKDGAEEEDEEDDEEDEEGNMISKSKMSPKGTEDDQEDQQISKEMQDETMSKSNKQKMIKKSISEENTLIKSMFDELGAKQSTQARALGTLMKGIMSQVGELRSELDSSKQELQEVRNELFKANDMIEEIGNQPSQRKTAVRAIERTFEKGLTENAPSNSNVLNSKTQKQQVLTLLDNMSFEKGFNADLAKAMTVYEGSGFLESHIVDLIKKEKGIAIV